MFGWTGKYGQFQFDCKLEWWECKLFYTFIFPTTILHLHSRERQRETAFAELYTYFYTRKTFYIEPRQAGLKYKKNNFWKLFYTAPAIFMGQFFYCLVMHEFLKYEKNQILHVYTNT